MKLFIDTNAWIALKCKRDNLHQSALETHRRLLKEGYHYITTDYVLDETYTGLRMKAGHPIAVEFGAMVQTSKLISVVDVTPQIRQSAWKLFQKYSDKYFSFTDCTSFVVMEQLGITQAFTNDSDFEKTENHFSILLPSQ